MLSLFRGNLGVMIGFMFMMSGTAAYDRSGARPTGPVYLKHPTCRAQSDALESVQKDTYASPPNS
jgi:hypothetical protein